MKTNGLPKSQRLCSRYLIDNLFAPGKSKSMTAYPLRVVYHKEEKTDWGGNENAILVSVPKKCFKHAVDRNHVKRQVREAYRNNRSLLVTPDDVVMHLAFIWLDNKHYPSHVVTAKVCNLLQRITERQ